MRKSKILKVNLKKLSDKDKAHLLGIEYREVGELIRYYGRLIWYVGATFLPLSLACFLVFEETEKSMLRVSVILASLFLVWLWFIIYRTCEGYGLVNYKRAKEIEKQLGFYNYLDVPEKDGNIFSLSISGLRLSLVIIITSAWVVRLLIMFYPKTALLYYISISIERFIKRFVWEFL